MTEVIVNDWTCSPECDNDRHNDCSGRLCLCGCHVLFGINDDLDRCDACGQSEPHDATACMGYPDAPEADDTDKINAHVAARYGLCEISDACARVIASQWMSGPLGASLATTGAILTADPSTVWCELFGSEYASLGTRDRMGADMLGTYLVKAGKRGPVPGWSGLWL